MRHIPTHSLVLTKQSSVSLIHFGSDLRRKVDHQRRCHHVHLTNTQNISRSSMGSL